MSLSFISLGLYDKEDVTLKGLNLIKEADVVYLEHYTSILHISVDELSHFYEKNIILATREMVEGDDNVILQDAKDKKVAFLVVGDCFSATTHSDLFLRANNQGIETQIVNNASIMTAIGMTGLQLYKFGKTTSLVFFEPDWKPQTAYDVIKQNQSQGLHTLCLLDIKVAEPTKKDLVDEHYVPQKPRFMTIKQALEQLIEIENDRDEKIVLSDTFCVGVARLGAKDQQIVFGTVEQLLSVDFGEPLHSLIFLGNLHFHEEEVLELFKL